MAKELRSGDEILKELRGYRESTFWNFIKSFQQVSLSREEVRNLYLSFDEEYDEKVLYFYGIVCMMGVSTGYGFIRLCFTKYPDLLEEVFSDEIDDDKSGNLRGISWLRVVLAEAGYVPSLETYDKLADSKHPLLYHFALEVCSLKKLKEHIGHKDKKARKIVFKRLGPVECLSEMLHDGTKDIRARGVEMAPMHCEIFSEMCEEANLQICNNLLKKGDDELVVLLMGNKNHNSNAFSGLLNFRIEEM